MKILKMTKEHLDSVLKIEQNSFTHPWSKESFLSELEKDSSFAFVVEENDDVVGYALMSTVLDEGSLLDIAVDSAHRRKGVANLLFSHLCEKAKEKNLSFITLEVRASNENAIAFYKKSGFETVALRKNYYTKPQEDAILMTKYF